jgi:hypothetical protein
MKRLRDTEVFDHIVLNFAAKTGSRVTLAEDFPPEIEKLESRLRPCGVPYDSEVIRDPETGKFVEKRFELVADFQGSVRVVPDHDSARVAFHVANVDGFDTVSVVFPAFEVGTARPTSSRARSPASSTRSCATASTSGSSRPERCSGRPARAG